MRPARGDQRETEVDELPQHRDRLRLVLIGNRHQHPAAFAGKAQPGAEEALEQRTGIGLVDAEHLAGRLHLGSENRFDAAHLGEREHRHFDHRVGRARAQARSPRHVAQLFAQRDARRRGDEVDAGRFRDDRHGAAGARVRFENVERAVVDDELDVDQPANAQLARDRLGDLADACFHLRTDGLGGKHADRIARVDARRVRRVRRCPE